MGDCTVIAQSYGDDVMEPYRRTLRRLDCPAQHHIWMLKNAVHAEAPSLMTGDPVRHLVRGPAVYSWRTRIASLVRRIVGNLGLIEIRSPAVPVPQNLILTVMLYKQSVDRDAVSIDHQSVLAGIQIPTHSVTVVRSPNPRMVHQCVVAVDPQIHLCAPHSGAANTKENIVQSNRILLMACPASLRTHLQQHRRLARPCV